MAPSVGCGLIARLLLQRVLRGAHATGVGVTERRLHACGRGPSDPWLPTNLEIKEFRKNLNA